MSPFVRTALILGLLCMTGPFAIDMYLPALPAITADLGATIGMTQMTLMVYFLAFGVSQIVYGPMADAYGRRLPILIGLGLFAVGSIGCLLAPSIGVLIAFRFVQGCGAAAAMVIPRAIIRDLYTGTEATRMMAMVMLVISVAPMLAPLAGSFLIEPFGWRSVFAAVLVVGLLNAFLVWKVLPETHVPARRSPMRFGRVAGDFGALLRDPVFVGLTLIGGFGMASFFTFLATASFVYIEHFGLTPRQFSIAFAFNAVGFFVMSQFAARLGVRFGLIRMVGAAVAGFAAGATTLLVLTLLGQTGFFVLAGLLFVTFACLGLVIPTVMVLALEENGARAGSASALGGTLQMLVGAVAISVVSLFFDGSTRPMVFGVAACGILAFIVSRLVLPRITPPAPAVVTAAGA